VTKTLDTLIEDIYSLFNTDHQIPEERLQEFGQRLASHLRSRINETRGPGSLRMSNMGQPCERKLYFSVHNSDEAEPSSPYLRLKFLIGDILEELVLWLAEEAGHSVEGRQDELNIDGVEGHRDAIIDGVIVDVKSASSLSFKKFENHLTELDDAFGYLTQLQSYSYASREDPRVTNKNMAAFVVIDKTLGKMCIDRHFGMASVDLSQTPSRKRAMLKSPEAPPRGFMLEDDGKSGNQKLGLNCSYCEFKWKCWDNLKVYNYSGKPRYLAVVKRPPNVDQLSKEAVFGKHE